MENIQTGELFAYTIRNMTVTIFQAAKNEPKFIKFIALHGKRWDKVYITEKEYLSLRKRIEQGSEDTVLNIHGLIIHPKRLE
jgi:hypothetical protein